QTRAEMKKGVFDLPEETKESTSAMRRAVTEQINALKELSEIVARTGRLHDVADPSARSLPRLAAPARQPDVVENTPVPAAPRNSDTAVTERPASESIAATDGPASTAGG